MPIRGLPRHRNLQRLKGTAEGGAPTETAASIAAFYGQTDPKPPCTVLITDTEVDMVDRSTVGAWRP